MSVVIEFPRCKRGAAPPVEIGASAQILFFTGVRYQRMTELSPGEHDGRRPSREGGKKRRKRG